MFIVDIVHVFVCVVHVCGFNKLLVYRQSVIEGKPLVCTVCAHANLLASSEQV